MDPEVLKDLLLTGSVPITAETFATPEALVTRIWEMQHLPPVRLSTLTSVRELEILASKSTGWIVQERLQDIATFVAALAQLPSRLKLLPFGRKRVVWI